MKQNITPGRLIARLVVYYGVFLSIVVSMLLTDADLLRYLPFAGTDALSGPTIEVTETSVRVPRSMLDTSGPPERITGEIVVSVILFLAATLVTTILVMLPVTWTYSATRFESGPSKVFVRTLLLLPICATTVVLLIQDSLPLAFGLAALVAAVRFRINLPETIDGIFIFAAICVGLAGGIGYMGVALIMTLIFTLTNAVLWQIDYGRNPVDEARRAADAKKLAKKLGNPAS
ncbi:MAG: DUF4956 domain-containing protein [Gammaproteobacteria bacterium]|nr:DUF4956 domain-containing protein [Gammaproteobacteria bacterium]MDH5344131.1 DUF4956 domain-containing protein [Gammaproteobacteria bacterium]